MRVGSRSWASGGEAAAGPAGRHGERALAGRPRFGEGGANVEHAAHGRACSPRCVATRGVGHMETIAPS